MGPKQGPGYSPSWVNGWNFENLAPNFTIICCTISPLPPPPYPHPLPTRDKWFGLKEPSHKSVGPPVMLQTALSTSKRIFSQVALYNVQYTVYGINWLLRASSLKLPSKLRYRSNPLVLLYLIVGPTPCGARNIFTKLLKEPSQRRVGI